jgi:hypothetical protein
MTDLLGAHVSTAGGTKEAPPRARAIAVELIVHRAGNRPGAPGGRGGGDLVEADVHLFRGRLEVRHEKALWPTTRLWERWELIERGTPRRALQDLLDADASAHLLLDLKGISPRLARAVRGALGERRPVTISTKSWWLLRTFQAMPGVRTFRSAGNRLELAWLLRVPSRLRPDGIVVHQRLLSAAVVDRLRHHAPAVWAWGAQNQAEAERLRSWGVDGLILDDVDLVRQLRRERDADEVAGD